VAVDVIVGFQPVGKTAKMPAGSTISQAAKQAGIGIRSECGGKGSCGKCKVIVRNSNAVSETTQTEKEHLSRSEIEADYRLACQTEILRDVTIEVPPESQLESRKIQILGLERKTALNPSLKKYHIELLEPTLSDTTPDLERLLTCLEREDKNLHSVAIDYRVLTDLPITLRRADWNIAVILWDDTKIVDVEPIAKSSDIFGLAVDIGTSKIVGHLVNLISGDTTAIESVENPQIVFGDDIITRITFAASDNTNLQTLRELLVDSVNKLLRRTCAKAKVDPSRVYHVVAVGNTAMHHFFLGIKPENIAISPFTPAVKRRVDVDAKDLQIEMALGGLIAIMEFTTGMETIVWKSCTRATSILNRRPRSTR